VVLVLPVGPTSSIRPGPLSKGGDCQLDKAIRRPDREDSKSLKIVEALPRESIGVCRTEPSFRCDNEKTQTSRLCKRRLEAVLTAGFVKSAKFWSEVPNQSPEGKQTQFSFGVFVRAEWLLQCPFQ
jgi:hypothetical protein